MSPKFLFLINLLSTWYMVGLIWLVQRVHYKLFDRVGAEGFTRYEADHCNLITPVVGPPMLLEIATAAMLVYATPVGVPRWAMWLGLAAVLGIWASTAVLQVPCHNRLGVAFSSQDYSLLVGSNWLRTVLWTARGILMAYFANKLFAAS